MSDNRSKLRPGQNKPATVGGYQGGADVNIAVKFWGREWPYGRVVVTFDDASVVMTPNQTRRVLGMLERAIDRAEDKLR